MADKNIHFCITQETSEYSTSTIRGTFERTLHAASKLVDGSETERRRAGDEINERRRGKKKLNERELGIQWSTVVLGDSRW